MQEVRIGHYILGKTIGTGGFAKVKEARHDLTGVRVAVKIINKRKMRSKNMIPKVKRQIKILKFINHENIIKLYEVLDTTNDIFVIMQLAEGGELYDYIQSNQISQQEAKFFFKQIVNGVRHAHANLISHRDLKPENILIDNNKLIKIVDFGLSNLMKDGRLLKTACGSPNYAAPQIVGQRKYQGTSVDIWSCGVILYALLVGSLPFDQQTALLLYRKIQQGNYTIPSSLNPLAADLIRRMLQVDPYKRIRMHQINNHPWIRKKVPLYAKIPQYYSLEKESNFQFDQQIYVKIMSMNFKHLNEIPQEKIKKSIKKRDDQSFVITYQLLKDDKYRQGTTKQGVIKNVDDNIISSIVCQVQNIIINDFSQYDKKDFIYGRKYNKPAKLLVEIIIQVFKQLGIQYTIKSPQYSIKCVYVPLSTTKINSKSKKSRQMQDENEEQPSKEQKFTKNKIKFNLQIYSLDTKGYQHIVDLQLTQGHPLVFFNCINKLFNMVELLAQHH